MVDDTRSGRHRNAVRYNPVAELSTIVKSAGETSVKASAVLAASGGLVAAFALPAQAAPGAPRLHQVHHDDGRRGARRRGEHHHRRPLRARARPGRGRPRRRPPRSPSRRSASSVSRPWPSRSPSRSPSPSRWRSPVRPGHPAVAEPHRLEQATSPASRSSTRYSNPAQSSSGVVNIARGLLGIPYVYGGSSPSGFDCSGFTPVRLRQGRHLHPAHGLGPAERRHPGQQPQAGRPGVLRLPGLPRRHLHRPRA